MGERNLIHRLRQHQPEALEELIQAYSPYVGTIVRNIIGQYLPESDVEELTADVFVAVWEHTEQLKVGKLSGYLAAIARNRAKNRIRSYHETVDLENLAEICAPENVEEAIDKKLLAEILQDVLDTLPAKDREILVRYYYCYESVKQVADALNMTESAVKMRMSRARKKLQQELVERGYAHEDSPAVQQIRFASV
ncbi:MAG: RNA polymerase sigma factor [Ruminococcus sp.]